MKKMIYTANILIPEDQMDSASWLIDRAIDGIGIEIESSNLTNGEKRKDAGCGDSCACHNCSYSDRCGWNSERSPIGCDRDAR